MNLSKLVAALLFMASVAHADPFEVSVAATSPNADSGAGQPGVFTVTLSSPATEATKIHFALSGTAVNGEDYARLGPKVKVAAGASSGTVIIRPQGTLEGASKKTVKLTLLARDGYTVGAQNSAKVKITHSNVINLP